MGFVIGYITTKDSKEAKKIADALLKKRLIACANVIPKIESAYWWKGKVERESEALLLVKTKSGKMKRIIELVKKLHSYDVPCVEFVPIVEGNKDYFSWIKKEVR